VYEGGRNTCCGLSSTTHCQRLCKRQNHLKALTAHPSTVGLRMPVPPVSNPVALFGHPKNHHSLPPSISCSAQIKTHDDRPCSLPPRAAPRLLPAGAPRTLPPPAAPPSPNIVHPANNAKESAPLGHSVSPPPGGISLPPAPDGFSPHPCARHRNPEDE
jgi:hypothetical protein